MKRRHSIVEQAGVYSWQWHLQWRYRYFRNGPVFMAVEAVEVLCWPVPRSCSLQPT